MPKGYLCLVLHAHLPFVRHPEYDDFLEEDWLFEAITETYIPLLDVFHGLEQDGVDWRMTMSITPPLAAMLADPLLQYRYVRHIDSLISLTVKELERTRWQPEFYRLAQMYHDLFNRCRDVFVNRCSNNLLNGFRHFFNTGKLELITCTATHGFLPLMNYNEKAMRAQIEIGCSEFERHFGRRPRGIWLAECGYVPGADRLLRDSGINYFYVDTHGVLFANPRPKYGVYAPVLCPQSNVAAFARDTESSKQVWSSLEGYPGDYEYREFYRDVGFDLDFDYLKPHLHSMGIRSNLGIKYYKITGPGDHKEPYNPQAATEKAASHAGNFMFNRERQIEWLAEQMPGRAPIIVAPYDAELFGHWWHEGPQWINFLLRKMHYDQDTIKPITASEYLERYPTNQVCQPPMCSWGAKGYCEVWLEGSNHWIYPHLHEIAERMTDLARAYPHPHALARRALNQAARELLLAQSSDWAFIMKTGTMVEYAVRRTHIHVLNFNHLYEEIRSDRIDEPWLVEIEQKNNIFPTIDYRIYA
jgi:1,4-alpha-glucan branching enzyme